MFLRRMVCREGVPKGDESCQSPCRFNRDISLRSQLASFTGSVIQISGKRYRFMDVLQDKPNQPSVHNPKILQRKQLLNRSWKVYLKLSSSICAVLGGSLVASNTPLSGNGFLLLVLSSSQLLVASLLDKDLLLIFYSASVFFFVDCLGVYRWLLT